YFASHEDGDEEDWDVIEGGGFLTDGDLGAWNELLGLGTEGVTSATQYAQMEKLLDMDSFVDSMIARIWSGDNDWLGPVFFGTFSTGVNNRNWFAGRRSRGGAGDEPFHFFTWDAEISLGNDRFLNSGNRLLNTDLTQVNTPNSPSVPYDGLRDYDEFRVKFADRLYRYFSNDGVFSPGRAQARWDALSDQVRTPVVAESARWGNIHGGVPLRRDVEWDRERLWVRDTFLAQRSDIVLDQFKARGLYPEVEPPEFPLVEGAVYPAPVDVALGVPAGQVGAIYYTLDGSDPRQSAAVDVSVLLPSNSPAKVLVPSVENGGSALGEGWKSFDDPVGIDGWIEGDSAVGFETQGLDYRSLLRVDVEQQMFGINGSVYMRVEFEVADQAAIDSIARLVLRLKYDDGFVAYLNGEKIAEANAPASPAWDSLSTAGNPDSAAVLYEEFDLTSQQSQLRVGRNVLALQGLNGALASSDLLLVPEIVASGVEVDAGVAATAVAYRGQFSMAQSGLVKTRFLSTTGVWSALREEPFVIGDRSATTGDLVVSELSYHPRDPEGAAEEAVAGGASDFEFLEVTNVSSDAVEMGGVRFDDGVDFVFPPSSLAPGESLVVVKKLDAFVVRFPTLGLDQIAGEFAAGTGLSNGGERLVLVDVADQILHDFEYDDRRPWPTLPDGDGPTLVLIDPGSNPDHAVATNWRASRVNDGVPGADEDSVDVDADGLADDWEQVFFGNLDEDGDGDSDGDSWTNAMEFAVGTNPRSGDTDNDGLSDSAEGTAGTDPLLRDSDGDGLPDGQEVGVTNTDPLRSDSDGDGLNDSYEVQVSRTDPNARDSDGDGSGDFSEVQRGSDPLLDTSIALSREGDFLIYASLESEISLGGGVLAMGAELVDGAIGKAVRLGVGNDLNYGELGDPGAANLTAILWVKLEALGGARALISKGDGWGIFAADGDLVLRLEGIPEIPLASGLAAGSWHQVAMVIDREIGIVRGFFDGEQVGSQPIADAVLIDSPGPLRLAGAGDVGVCVDEFSLLRFAMNPMELRGLSDGVAAGLRSIDIVGGGDRDLDGLPDDWELSVFGDLNQVGSGDLDGDGLTNLDEFLAGTDPNEADSDGDGSRDRDEILAGSDPLQGGVVSRFEEDLLLFSSFDRETLTGLDSGARLFDLTVPSENGTIIGGVDLVPGRAGEAARSVLGSVRYGDVHDPGAGSYSVSIWFKADRLEANEVQRVVGKGRVNEDGASAGWQILVFGEEVAVIGGQEGGGEWFMRGMPEGQSRLRIGEWNHASLVIDRSAAAGRIRLYVNGTEIEDDGFGEVMLAEAGEIGSDQPLTTHAASGGGQRFSGAVDELAIWGRTISADDVSAIYRGGLLTLGLEDLGDSAGIEPKLAVMPEEILMVLNPGGSGRFEAVLANAGTGRVQWIGELEFAEELSLETALDRFDAGATPILEAIPFRYAFTEGMAGDNIADGGMDMFDGGNFLSTDLVEDIPYSDGVVIDSAAFGENGRYFTRKLAAGLFVLGADLDGVDSFSLSGDLGADGVGTADGVVLTIGRAGREFLGFVKRVYDGFDPGNGLFDPSVNHLIIVEDNGGAEQTFSSSTNSDAHEVSGLAGTRRLYHLLFSTSEGRKVEDEEARGLFETFLDTVGVAPGWANLAESGGQVPAAGQAALGLDFNTDRLQVGTERATLRFFSNDPDAARIEVPVRLRVNARPSAIGFPQLAGLEDSEPLVIDLDTAFGDDGRADGEELIYELLTITDPSLIDRTATTLVGNELSVALVPDAFGQANISLRATDPQGLSRVGAVRVRIEPVNDLPEVARPFVVSVEEDSGPVFVLLREFFSDVEDPNVALTFGLGTLLPGSALGPPFLDGVNGQLMVGLLPDANGVEFVPVRVFDLDGGMIEVDLRVEIVAVPDAPEKVGAIPQIVADEIASDVGFSVIPFFEDPDVGDSLVYSLVANSNPALFSSLRVDAVTGELAIGYAPFVSGSAELRIRATDQTGLFAEQTVTVVLPEIDAPGVTLGSEMRLNRQTGLWEQTVTIHNGAPRDIGAVRLLISGLAPGIIVYNASSHLPDGRAALIYNRTLPAGETVQIVLEYYSRDRSSDIAPQVEAEVSLRQTVLTDGQSFAIDRVLRLPDGGVLVEFPSEPGALYMVQYSAGMVDWKDAFVRLRAGGTRVQWIDRGAPATDSLPLGGGARFYRVMRVGVAED
ncbi:MAG: hypothetical protein ACI8XO_002802, partial [Verrucomicrobiales bacterium]